MSRTLYSNMEYSLPLIFTDLTLATLAQQSPATSQKETHALHNILPYEILAPQTNM